MDAWAPPTPPMFGLPFDAGPMDSPGCVGEAFCPTPIPPDPTDVVPPTPPCLPDGGGFDAWPTTAQGSPCLHYVTCTGNFATTFINGRCVAGSTPSGFVCEFSEPPTFEYCFGGCGLGWSSGGDRCLNPGPTAP
jgi:hypothetical protein